MSSQLTSYLLFLLAFLNCAEAQCYGRLCVSWPYDTTLATSYKTTFWTVSLLNSTTAEATVSATSIIFSNSTSLPVVTSTTTVSSGVLIDPTFTSSNTSISIPATSSSPFSNTSITSSELPSITPTLTSASVSSFTVSSTPISTSSLSLSTISSVSTSSIVTESPSLSPSTSTSSSGTPTSSEEPPSSTTSEFPFCMPSITESLIENGDFETGLSPWSVDLVDVLSTSYGTDAPGANGSCTAFQIDMQATSLSDDLMANLRLVPALLLFPRAAQMSVAYTVSFAVRFAARNEARLDVFANGVILRSIVSQDVGTEWVSVEMPYAVSDRIVQFEFTFVLGDASENTIWFDRVGMETE
ncbi:hypothetical protein DL764_007640 [Monosporascus ibericus]|uniref:CBM-cenC domain-containing protein n=1 Tax=Monosporascus ibericus TaxID=155417 RepID=A0A4Q4T1N4_9PEZI|nr:hypothetical protein DL764_007640 [Monosporascus ibericus]